MIAHQLELFILLLLFPIELPTHINSEPRKPRDYFVRFLPIDLTDLILSSA